MSEDPTRATRRPDPPRPDSPRHGSVGPLDPHADPATDPALRPVGPARGHDEHDGPTLPVTAAPPEPPTEPLRRDGTVVPRSRTGGLYLGLILSAVVLVFLLVFILQNLTSVRIEFLAFGGNLPIGVAMLLSAIAGLLLVAIPGGLRIMQLRRVARRAGRER